MAGLGNYLIFSTRILAFPLNVLFFVNLRISISIHTSSCKFNYIRHRNKNCAINVIFPEFHVTTRQRV